MLTLTNIFRFYVLKGDGRTGDGCAKISLTLFTILTTEIKEPKSNVKISNNRAIDRYGWTIHQGFHGQLKRLLLFFDVKQINGGLSLTVRRERQKNRPYSWYRNIRSDFVISRYFTHHRFAPSSILYYGTYRMYHSIRCVSFDSTIQTIRFYDTYHSRRFPPYDYTIHTIRFYDTYRTILRYAPYNTIRYVPYDTCHSILRSVPYDTITRQKRFTQVLLLYASTPT